MESATSLLEAVSLRSQHYYFICFLEPENTEWWRQESTPRVKGPRLMFQDVTPFFAQDEDGERIVIFKIALKTETNSLSLIHRNLGQIEELHRTLLLVNTPNMERQFTFPNPSFLTRMTNNQLTELSYSLLTLLNDLTRIDSVLFSDTFYAFLFIKDIPKFIPYKVTAIRHDSNNNHPEERVEERVKFDIVSAQTVVEGDAIFTLYGIQLSGKGKSVTVKRR